MKALGGRTITGTPPSNSKKASASNDQKAGIYLTTERAAYWDGKNATGETVSSGVYFYQLQAGDFLATRKMVIVK